MNADNLKTIEELKAFLAGTQLAAFEVVSDSACGDSGAAAGQGDSQDSRYRWIERMLVRFRYLTALNLREKGVVIRYLMKVSGYSRQQVTRLIGQYREHGRLVRRQRTTRGFRKRFAARDIRLLAELDRRHETLNGLTTKKLCERAYRVFGQEEYQALSTISIAMTRPPSSSRKPDGNSLQPSMNRRNDPL